jgi:hypothetical protein
VFLSGELIPGDDPGTMTIGGNLTENAGGVLLMEVAGAGAGQYSTLNVSGTGTYGGTIDVDFIDGFAPTSGQTFALINDTGGADFSMSNLEISGLAGGFQYTTQFANGIFSLTAENDGVSAAPEPGSWAMLAMTIALAGLRGLRRVTAGRACLIARAR